MGVLVTSLPPVVMLAVSLLNGRGIALGEAVTSPTAPIAHAHALRLLHPGPGVAVRAEALARGISQEPATLAAVRVELSRNF